MTAIDYRMGETDLDCRCAHELIAAVEAAHGDAREALSADHPGRYDAVIWMSAHLAAVEHALHPAMRRRFGADDTDLQTARQVAHELQVTLRIAEQLAAGDSLISRAEPESVRLRLLDLLDQHTAIEHRLLCRLAAGVTAPEVTDFARRYSETLLTGPTRPHPHGPHRGILEPLVFEFDRLRDHALDLMDNRVLPLPRRPQPTRPAPGRWGHYLLGSMQPHSTDSDEA